MLKRLIEWLTGHHHHMWGKWSSPYIINIRRRYTAHEVPVDFQRRTCKTCGLKEEQELCITLTT